MRRSFVATAASALVLSADAGADGGPQATALAEAGGVLWTTVRGGVVAIDPQSAELRLPARALVTPDGGVGRIVGGRDAVWGLRPWTLVRLDVNRPEAIRTVSVPGPAYASAGGRELVWVADYERGRLVAVDRRAQIVRRITGLPKGATAVTSDGTSVWVASIGPWRKGRGGVLVPLGDGVVTRVDARSGEIRTRVRVGRAPGAVAVGAGAVWVASFRGIRPANTVTRIDPERDRAVATIAVPARPTAVAVDRRAVWVAGFREPAGPATLTRIDPATNRAVTRRLPAAYPAAIVAHSESLWVADEGRGEIIRVDPMTGRRTGVVSVLGVSARPATASVLFPGTRGDATRHVPLLAVVAGVLAVLTAAALVAGRVVPSTRVRPRASRRS